MTAPVLGTRCTVCGARPQGRVAVSLHGEPTCATHPVAGRCIFCSRPHPAPRPPGWSRFSRSTLRCPTCAADAVADQLDARRMLPAIRADLAAIGIGLTHRVRVRLVDGDALDAPLPAGTTGAVLAVTEHRMLPGRGRETVEIRVGAGLPPDHFGRAVAHEMGHAWLVEQDGPRLAPELEEGLCELFSHAWLKKQDTPLTDEMRRHMRENPDPTYGGGLRTVLAAVHAHGIRAVLGALARRGALP